MHCSFVLFSHLFISSHSPGWLYTYTRDVSFYSEWDEKITTVTLRYSEMESDNSEYGISAVYPFCLTCQAKAAYYRYDDPSRKPYLLRVRGDLDASIFDDKGFYRIYMRDEPADTIQVTLYSVAMLICYCFV
jgi:hypothetical protein